ncbi:hypothetical protein [Cohnella sp. 56]|uniref:hypothetical protein n=1 Tax=Cohnella sp. 56 TaxID=3113722 RepID=UPI0030E7C76E
MKVIAGTAKMDSPPRWAVLERELLAAMERVWEPVMAKYVLPDGRLMWPPLPGHEGIDALDDAYESFHNWPLLYLLGGSEQYLRLSEREYDAITAQFAGYGTGHGHPMVVKEYEQGYDWFHQGEGYLFFYHLNLANPGGARQRERAVRYAGFYLNEDPAAANYDERRRLIRCAHTGSMGPAYRNFDGKPWIYEEWKSFYGLPFADVPGCGTIEDIREPANAAAMGEAMRERMSRGDVVANLAATTMVTNAYLHTGAEKYRDWVLSYVEAWMARVRDNGGIVPDNVGLSGQVGEYTNGKWYGGYYGWTWPHGWLSVGDAMLVAAENATLLSGDTSYLSFAREQIDQLAARGVMQGGTLRVPYKYGDPGTYRYRLWIEGVAMQDDGDLLWRDGWFEFQPMDARYPVHLWHLSREAGDWERVKALRNYDKRDWERVLPKPAKDLGGHEAAWAEYLNGGFPDYPERILAYNLGQVAERLRFMAEDEQDPLTYTDSYLQARNPVTVEGLVHLTMGAPLPMYNGGLLMAVFAYADPARGRPGLPEDVAALAEEIGGEHAVLRLVNLNPDGARRVVVRAGAYGEHRFERVRYADASHPGEVRTEEIGAAAFEVVLPPYSHMRLELEMKRFANRPSYGAYAVLHR